ncbi:tudor domain-containing protein 15 [Aplochiton taeniatus]
MGSQLHPEQQKSVEAPRRSAPCALWPVDLKLTHVDCHPDATLVHFQGKHITVCELDYSILQVEIQNAAKMPWLPASEVAVGELCLVEDVASARWFRGRVQNQRRRDLYDVFLVDYGNVLSVHGSHLSSCSDDLFMLPPKIVCGFFSNVLPGKKRWDEAVQKYFSSLIGSQVEGYIQALLPHKVLILEAPDVNRYLSTAGFGKHVDTDTFLLLVEMLTDVPLKKSVEPVPDLLIEKPSGQEFSFKPSSLQGFENILSFCGPKWTAGKRLTVRVTAAVNPGNFYCQMTSLATDLSAMSLRLAATCESKSRGSLQKAVENLGLLCSVKGKDDRWYRGFVQFLPVNSQVRVLFVDYGFCESVKAENVLRLPSNLLFTPIMAFPCSLACLNEQDEARRTEQLGYLKRGLLGEVLNMEISGFDKEQNLYSVTLLSAEENVVAEEKTSDARQQVHPVPAQKKTDILCVKEEFFPPSSHYCYETAVIQGFNNSIQTEEVSSVFEGYVEHIINPNHFYIRTQKRNRHFEELMNKMAAHFSTVALEEDVLVDPDRGTLCCAMYEKDMHYYRAMVTDTLEHGSEVFFIDFGNVEKVPRMLIKKIPEGFVSEPAFALSCSLVDVLPVDDCWTCANTDWFRRATNGKVLLVRVVHLQEAKCIVDLYEEGKENLQSITEVMTSAKQAEFWKYTPSEPVDVEAKKKVTKKYHKRKEPKTGQRGTSKSLARKQWETVPLEPKQKPSPAIMKEAVEIPKEETTAATNRTDLVPTTALGPVVHPTFRPLTFKPGCEFAVSVSHVGSPADFWCQQPSKAPLFDGLMDDIQQYYAAHSVAVPTGASCCVARLPGDGRWSRACITGEFADGSLRVILVDYGITICTDIQELQAILPEHLELEGQAFRCSLYNLVQPLASSSTGEWSAEACTSFKSFVSDHNGSLTCCVISQLFVRNKGSCNVVDLVSSDAGQSASQRLVEQGLARGVNRPTQLLPSVFAESFVFSAFGLCSGRQEQVYVTHVDGTEEMYVQLERNSQVIEELGKKVAEFSKKTPQAKSGGEIGKLCLAKYYDGDWYRAKAMQSHSPLHRSVLFVDYGDTRVVEERNVVSLPRGAVDLLLTPMQAVRCSLARVQAVENYAEVNSWLAKTVLNKLVRAVVVGKSEEGSYVVELYDGDVHVNEKVNKLVASLAPKVNEKRDKLTTSLAPKVDEKRDKLTTSLAPKVNEKRDMLTTCLAPKVSEKEQISASHGKEIQHSIREWKTPRSGHKCRNRYHHRRSFSPSSSSSSSRSPQRLKSSPHSDLQEKNKKVQCDDTTGVEVEGNGKTGPNNKETIQLAPIPLEIPTKLSSLPDNKVRPGLRALCYASHIDALTSFFVQMQDDEPAILKMLEDINSELFKEALESNPSTQLSLNDVVLAEYEEDGALYRAVVKDCLSNGLFKVEFIDYGNSAVVSREKTYPMSPGGLSQPRLSVPCALVHGSVPHGDAAFSQALVGKALTVDFVSRVGTHWEVEVAIQEGDDVAVVTPDTAGSHSDATETREEGAPLPESPAVSPDSVGYYSNVTETQEEGPASGSCMVVTPERETPWQPNSPHNGTLLSVLDDGYFYVRVEEYSEMLCSLQSLLVDSLGKGRALPEEQVKEGLRCLIQSDGIHQWHRALVQNVAQGQCQVFLVDHGTTEEVSVSRLRELCDQLTLPPALAVLCKWNNLGFPVDKDARLLWQKTIQPMVGEDLKLVFVSYSDSDHAWMVDVNINGLFLLRQGKIKNHAYSAYAAAVTTPSEFHVVLDNLLLVMSRVSAILDGLPETVSALPGALLAPGSCCLVRCHAKNRWCRAQVVEADHALVVLSLVDYGHCLDVAHDDRSEIKSLPEELAKLPKVTYPCTLRGVKPVGVEGQWSGEALVFFQECMCKRSLQLFFRDNNVSEEDQWEVDVLADGTHVAVEMVEAGHAVYTDMVLGLRAHWMKRVPGNLLQGAHWLRKTTRKPERSVGKMETATLRPQLQPERLELTPRYSAPRLELVDP